MAELVMELAGVSREVAEAALATHKEVWIAVDALLPTAPTSGVRPKPVIDTGLTPEQDALCRRGRWLQDRVNAVCSVAHSKTLRPSDDQPEAAQTDLALTDASPGPVAPPSSPQLLDGPSQTPQ